MYELTDEQEAFMRAEGKNVLCACPGSGKTYIVARKVLKYLHQWKKNHQGMAVLSFTNIASKEIMDQIEQLIGVSGKIDYPHFVGTVDSFINNFIVLQYGYLYNENRARPQVTLSNIWNYQFRFWRTECHRKGCSDSIEKFYYGIDGKLYKNHSEVICEPNSGRKVPPCAQYKKIYEKKGIVFQSEVSSFAYRLLNENPCIAQAIASRFPVILIDEAQDTSEEQMAVFDLLFTAGVEKTFLVGDPDQSIYEWRNATPKCFVQKMQEDDWKTLMLTANFRSSQRICNAVRYFSQSLEDKAANTAKGPFAAEEQKPILLLHSMQTGQEKIYEYFKNKCKEMEIEVVSDKVAIVTRSKIHSDSDISGLWKSSEVEMFARSAYEWYFGSRKKAFSLCEQAIYSMTIGDLKSIHSIEDEINRVIPYYKWKLGIINIMTNYPSLDTPISGWINQFKCTLNQLLESSNLVQREGKDIANVVKIKTRDTKMKDFKEKPIRVFFEKKNKESYTRSSVHGVKGETYEAVLLHVQHQKGSNTLTPSFLNNGALDSELMRIAYVGMTRPRRLLVVAMPGTDKKAEYPRFPKSEWEHVFIK
ncbi:Superfamily I DNA or RNA helicase [Anaerovirgula multivorans]|uniref:Superfamily I DNA or RNA helicase n=1 Tax=Anaerovirgula multivorans TaxID=312168 RepID=A0A239GLS7_9FIRM|nr:ATP-dependent helicase [Anaerovirgula multivorans]SNS69941.1 Superfamily I DNA or RNA helicase [Anaerovirgula multivorans]